MKKANLKRIISAICLLGMLSSLTACANEPVSSKGTVSDENASADMEKNPAENNGETPPEKPDGEPGQAPDGGTPPDKPGENRKLSSQLQQKTSSGDLRPRQKRGLEFIRLTTSFTSS